LNKTSKMTRYPTTWVDFQLPSGQKFAVSVCGFSGKVCQMFIGDDTVRRTYLRHVEVNETSCSSGGHCLSSECTLNHTGREHLFHMLDLTGDEQLTGQTAAAWGTASTVDSLVEFANKMNAIIPPHLKKERQPMP
jgi:hypothetical protein